MTTDVDSIELHFDRTQLEAHKFAKTLPGGGLLIVLVAEPAGIATAEKASELIRGQIEALREFASLFEKAAQDEREALRRTAKNRKRDALP